MLHDNIHFDVQTFLMPLFFRATWLLATTWGEGGGGGGPVLGGCSGAELALCTEGRFRNSWGGGVVTGDGLASPPTTTHHGGRGGQDGGRGEGPRGSVGAAVAAPGARVVGGRGPSGFAPPPPPPCRWSTDMVRLKWPSPETLQGGGRLAGTRAFESPRLFAFKKNPRPVKQTEGPFRG